MKINRNKNSLSAVLRAKREAENQERIKVTIKKAATNQKKAKDPLKGTLNQDINKPSSSITKETTFKGGKHGQGEKEAKTSGLAGQNNTKEELSNLLQSKWNQHQLEAGVGQNDYPTLNREIPVLLMPIRVLTRYIRKENRRGKTIGYQLRIFFVPDTIFHDKHDELLSELECDEVAQFIQSIVNNGSGVGPSAQLFSEISANDETKQAFNELANKLGANRAVWALKEYLNQGEEGCPVSDNPMMGRISVLPDKFWVRGLRNEQEIFKCSGNPVVEEIVFLQEDSDESNIMKRYGWLTDYDKAVDIGMALSVDLPLEKANIDQLLVFGLRTAGDSEEQAEELAELLTGHRYTDEGASFVPIGGLTNNDGSDESLFNSEINAEEVLEREMSSEDTVTEATDGYKLAYALGLVPKDLANINEDETKQLEAINKLPGAQKSERRVINALSDTLWGATIGHYLEQYIVDSKFQDDKLLLSQIKHHYSNYIYGRGPFPNLRILKTPLGILPVTNFNKFEDRTIEIGDKVQNIIKKKKTSKGATFSIFKKIIINAKKDWLKATRFIPPSSDLPAVMSQEAVSGSLKRRLASTKPEREHTWGSGLVSDALARQLEHLGVAANVDKLESLFFSAQAAYESLYDPEYVLGTDPLASLEALISNDTSEIPEIDRNSLWYQLLLASKEHMDNEDSLFQRLYGHFQLSDDAQASQLVSESAINSGQIVKATEGINSGYVKRSDDAQASQLVSESAINSGQIVKATEGTNSGYMKRSDLGLAILKEAKKGWSVSATRLKDAINSAGWTQNEMREQLNYILRELLDVSSHRLDAWITSFATRRLEEIRGDSEVAKGIYIGAFGWLENLKPDADEGAAQETNESQGKGYNMPSEDIRNLFATNTKSPTNLEIVTNQRISVSQDTTLNKNNPVFKPVKNPRFPKQDAKPTLNPKPEEKLTAASSGGFILAANPNIAKTAAIVCSAHMSKSLEDKSSAAELDLPSERVSLAKWIMEGTRMNNPLATLLGYRFVRSMEDTAVNALGSTNTAEIILPSYISIFKKYYPFDGSSKKSNDPDAHEPLGLIDGLTLVKDWRKLHLNNSNPPNHVLGISELPEINSRNSDGEAEALLNQLQKLDQVFDALQDTALFEQVYRIITGDKKGASAVAAAMAGKRDFPELVCDQVQSGGAHFYYDLVLNLNSDEDDISGWPLDRPKAIAHPKLEKWTGKILGNPNDIGFPVSYRSRYTKYEDVITFADLNICALDCLAYSNAGVDAQQGELELLIQNYINQQDNDVTDIKIYFNEDAQWVGNRTSKSKPTHYFIHVLPLLQEIRKLFEQSISIGLEQYVDENGTILARYNETSISQIAEQTQKALQTYWQAYANVRQRLGLNTVTLNSDVEGVIEHTRLGPDTTLLGYPSYLADYELKLHLVGLGILSATPNTEDPIPAEPEDTEEFEKCKTYWITFSEILRKRINALGYSVDPDAVNDPENPIQSISQLFTKLGYQTESSNAKKHCDFCQKTLQALFSHGWPVTPELILENKPTTLPVPEADLDRWLFQVKYFEEGFYNVEMLKLFANDQAQSYLGLSTTQQSHGRDHWIGLTFKSKPPMSVQSVSYIGKTSDEIESISGLLIGSYDEEVSCNTLEQDEHNQGEETNTDNSESLIRKEEAMLAFHFDQPNSEPPQTMLVAVPPGKKDINACWCVDDLFDILNDTIELAKIRMVDHHMLEGYGQWLPTAFVHSDKP